MGQLKSSLAKGSIYDRYLLWFQSEGKEEERYTYELVVGFISMFVLANGGFDGV